MSALVIFAGFLVIPYIAPSLVSNGGLHIDQLTWIYLVGGGSLNYANTLYEPPAPFFEDPQWAHITDWRGAPQSTWIVRVLQVMSSS